MDPEEPHWISKDPREIEKIISPIRYVQAKDKQRVIDDHVKNAEEETILARSLLPCLLDIPYGPRKDTDLLDIYGTDLSSSAPILIFIHGGAWVTGSKEHSAYFARNLHEIGVKTAVVGYVLMPDSSIREMCEKVEKAVEKVGLLYPSARLLLSGHSAGAHLIASLLLGTTGLVANNPDLVERIGGFMLLSGLLDLRTIQNTIVNELLMLTPDEAAELSPVLNCHKIPEPFLQKKRPLRVLMALGKFDPPEFQRQGKRMVRGLLTRGLSHVEYWECEEDDHFSIVASMGEKDSLMGRKLRDFVAFACNFESIEFNSKL